MSEIQPIPMVEAVESTVLEKKMIEKYAAFPEDDPHVLALDMRVRRDYWDDQIRALKVSLDSPGTSENARIELEENLENARKRIAMLGEREDNLLNSAAYRKAANQIANDRAEINEAHKAEAGIDKSTGEQKPAGTYDRKTYGLDMTRYSLNKILWSIREFND